MNRILSTYRQTTILICFVVVLLIYSCKETYLAPPLPISSSQNIDPVEGTFRLTEPDTISWTELDFPGLDQLTSRPFSLEKIEKHFFELENSDSIKGEFQTKTIDWDNLETKPINFESWPKDKLRFKTKQLGKPKIVKAGNLSLNQASSVGVKEIGNDFGIEGNITGLMKDSNEFLWFSGSNSIIKYDGSNLHFYGSSQGLSVNTVYTIFEASNGLFWVGDSKSIKAIDFQNNLVYELETFLRTRLIYYITEDDKGRIWLTNNGVGFSMIDLEKDEIRQFTIDQGLINPFSTQSFVDDDGTIWLTSDGGINILDFDANTMKILTQKDVIGKIGGASVTKNKEGDYWLSTDGGINILSKSKDSITHIGEFNIDNQFGNFVVLQVDNNGIYWMGNTLGRLYALDWQKKSYMSYNLNPGANKVVYNLEFDDNNQLWLALVTGGAFVVDISGNQPANITAQKGLIDSNVWGTLQATDGKKWIGTYNGVDVIDLKSKTIQHLKTEQGLLDNYNTQLFQDDDDKIWLFSNDTGISIIDEELGRIYKYPISLNLDVPITTILELDNNDFLIGTRRGKIFSLNLNNNTLRSFQLGEFDATYRITDFMKINNKSVWLSTRDHGVYKLNLGDNQIHKIEGNNILDTDSFYSILLEQDNLWIATFHGIHFLDFSDNKSYTFTLSQGLPANDVYDLVGNDSFIYAGTSFGLAIISKVEDERSDGPNWRVETIGKEQGLAHVDFAQNSMSIDEKGRIWAGVDSEALTVIEVNGNKDLSTKTVITGLSIYDKIKDFYNYTSPNIKVDIDTIWSVDEQSYELAPDYFKSREIDTSRIEYNGIYSAYNLPKDLKLPPDQNFLTFTYHGSQFRDQNSIIYTYFLEGIDRNWSQVTTLTKTENYRDLHEGNYVFKVASKNIYSDWSEPTEFAFTILPHWYQTWWAYLLFFLIFCSLLYATIQYRSQWLKKENKLLEEKVSLRTEQLRNKIDQLKSTQSQLIQSEKMASLGELTAGIAHEIQNPLNFVNNFSEVNTELIDEMKEELKKGDYDEAIAISNDIRENQQKINHHGKRADAIVKGMLQHSRSSSNVKEPSDINAIADEYLRLAYHGLRAKDKSFNATMQTDFDESIGKINIVPQDIGRVILNLITNAFHACTERSRSETAKSKIENENPETKYEPTVWVATKRIGNQVKISIRDNGNGIPAKVKDKIFQPFFTTKPSGQGTGLGLSLSYDIVQTHGGELSLETKEGQGTTFTITLPEL